MIVPLLILALATALVPLDTLGVAPPAHVAVNVSFVPYTPLTVPLFATAVVPFFTVVDPATFALVNAYVLDAALY